MFQASFWTSILSIKAQWTYFLKPHRTCAFEQKQLFSSLRESLKKERVRVDSQPLLNRKSHLIKYLLNLRPKEHVSPMFLFWEGDNEREFGDI